MPKDPPPTSHLTDWDMRRWKVEDRGLAIDTLTDGQGDVNHHYHYCGHLTTVLAIFPKDWTKV
jgi:hypothetical protein